MSPKPVPLRVILEASALGLRIDARRWLGGSARYTFWRSTCGHRFRLQWKSVKHHWRGCPVCMRGSHVARKRTARRKAQMLRDRAIGELARALRRDIAAGAMTQPATKRVVLMSSERAWIRIPRRTFDALADAALKRGIGAEELATLLLDVIAFDRLATAVLDDVARAA